MCLPETLDTIGAEECAALRSFAEGDCPRHAFRQRANDEGIAWVVLEPEPHAPLPRFTICRIAPCVMVLVEEASGARTIRSAVDLGAAMDFVRSVAEQSRLAAITAHPQHATIQ